MSRFADVTSDTPHGPRPVPKGHVPAQDEKPKRAVSPVLLLAGAGLALTIGALAARAAYDAVSDDKRHPKQGPRPRHAPGFAALDSEAQRAMRSRAQADFADYDERAAELRAAALRSRREARARAEAQARRRRKSRSASLGNGIGDAARNIAAFVTAASAAFEAFRQVSENSDEIMRNFSNSADRVREFLGVKPAEPEGDAAAASTGKDDADERRAHKL